MTKTPTAEQDARLWLRAALIVVGTFGVVRSLRYLFMFGDERLPKGMQLLSTTVPIWVWGTLWLAAGLFAWANIWAVKPSGSLPVVALCLVWAVGYTASWIVGLTNLPPGSPARGDYLGASTYWTVALLLVCGYFLARTAVRGRPATTKA